MNKQNKNGITLIALIITIIVMLILVGVTVTVAINGGLFTSAKEGAEGTTIARVKEQIMGDITVKMAEKLGDNITESELETIAQKYGTIIEKDGIKYLKLTDGGYEVPLSEIWQAKTVATLALLYCDVDGCTNEEHLHKGDYVEYSPKTAQTTYAPDKGEGIGKYTGYTSGSQEQSISQESLNWRVLGKDDKGNILLISGAPTTAGVYFSGYVGYNNFEAVLKDTCGALYSNTKLGATATSLTMKDIDTYLGGNAFTKENYGGGSSSKGGYGYQNANEITSKFTYNKDTNTLAKADTTIPAKSLTSNAYNYSIEDTITDSKNKEILQGTNSAKPYYYWVASRSVYVRSVSLSGDYAYWCLGCVHDGYVNAGYTFCDSVGGKYGESICLRPVVSLPSSVTIDDVKKKSDTVTETWNDPLGKYE